MSLRKAVVCIVITCVIFCLHLAIEASTPSRQMYPVRLALIQPTANGKLVRTFQPLLLVQEGQTARLDVRRDVKSPHLIDGKSPLRSGHVFEITIFRKGDQFLLNASASLTKASPADDDGVRLATLGLRVIDTVKLEEKLVVPIDGQNTSRWELEIQAPQTHQR